MHLGKANGMRLLRLLPIAWLVLAGLGCNSGPKDEVVTDPGPKVPDSQLGQAGGKGDGPDQKGDFKPLPPN
jgi:hypothetical protein